MALSVYKFKKLQTIRRIYLKSVFSVIISAFIIYTISKIILPKSIINLLILSIVFLLAYIILLILIKGFEKEDLTIIKIIKDKIFSNKNKK